MNCHIDLSTGEITTPALAQPPGQLLSKAVGTSTRLDGTISDISWNDGLFLGKGIDAMTGDVRGSAIDSFTTEQHGTQKIEQSTRYLMSSEDVEKEIEASVSLKFNLGNFSAGFLPAEVREQMHFDWSAAQQRRFERTLKVASAVNRLLPRVVRQAPTLLFMRDFRRRLRKGLPMV